METILQLIVNGISVGSIYAVVSVGFALIFGVVQMINFAHAEFYMLGAYGFYILYVLLGWPILVAALVVVAAMGLVGFLMQRGLRLDPNTPFETMILLTLGVSVTVQNGALAIFGNNARSAATPTSNVILTLGPASISQQRALIVVAAIVFFVLLDYTLQRTKIGKAMRAVAQNNEVASVVGIEIGRISSLTFVIGVGLAGVAGVMVAPAFFILPTMGILLIPKMFAVVVMGGRGNVRGAFIASFALGIVESLGTFYVGLAFRDLFGFLLLIAVLLAKPEGLFGRKAGAL